jgi:hypothetical protein
MEQQSYFDIKRQRRNLVLWLVAAIAVIDGAVLLATGSDMESFASDLSRIGTVGAAAVMSLVIIARQKVGGLFGRAYASVAAGLILWLAAESIWGYYELGLGVETRVSSIADVFWISGYGPFAYHLFSTTRFFGKGVKKSRVMLVSAAAAVFLVFYAQGAVSISALEGPEGFSTLAVAIAYPVLDAVLIVPAVLMVMNAGRGQLTSIPWIFVGCILLVAADSLLGIAAVIGMSEPVFHITMTYNAAYLCFMAGLMWYNRQFIISEKKMMTGQ